MFSGTSAHSAHSAFAETQDSIARWHWRRSSGMLAETQHALSRSRRKTSEVSPIFPMSLSWRQAKHPQHRTWLLKTVRGALRKWNHHLLWKGFS